VEELDNDEFGSCIGAFGKNRAMARTALSCEHETRGDSKEDDQRFFPPNGDQHLFPIGEEVICKLLKETRAGKTLRFAEKTKKKKKPSSKRYVLIRAFLSFCSISVSSDDTIERKGMD